MSGHTPGPTARRKSALLWGVVGGLSFLVLVQGYALLATPIVPIGRALAIAAPAGLGAALGAYLLEPYAAALAADRAEE